MLGHKKRRAKLAFNAAILTTFGKLDQQDIKTIDGNADRLLTELVRRYEWTSKKAESNVERFCADLVRPAPRGSIRLPVGAVA